MRLSFLGAAGTVTGSKYLVQTARGARLLVDCGLFQGLKDLRLKNWARLPVPAGSIDALALTHAHLDHSGYLPALVKQGFRGRAHCTAATRELCAILLPDSGHLQEQDAEFANRHRFSKHHPALALYTQEDAERCLRLLEPEHFHKPVQVKGATLTFRRAGHILGAASVELAEDGLKVVFSGDVGRYGDPIMLDPEPVEEADYLLVESTYGDRRHDQADPADALGEVVRRTAGRGGTVVIPAFAVGRAQHLLFLLHKLKATGAIPDLPVFLDSPMADDVSDLYCRRASDHRLSEGEVREAFGVARFTRSVEESKEINQSSMPKVIVSASGMATGGRVLHHLRAYVPDNRNTVVLAGFQAAGTRGRRLQEGEKQLKMFGQMIPVEAEIVELSMLSAHADCDELMRWLGGFRRPPKRTFIVHGEPDASAALKVRIEREMGWSCHIPSLGEGVELT